MSGRDDERYFAALRKQRAAAEQARALRKQMRRAEREEQRQVVRIDEVRIAGDEQHG
jgi:hypothetical protein